MRGRNSFSDKRPARAAFLLAVFVLCLLGTVPVAARAAEGEASGNAFSQQEQERELSQSELRRLTAALDFNDIGFFACTYYRPEEIDWHEVLYNGAGIASGATRLQRQRYEELSGFPLETGIVAIYGSDIRRFVKNKTGMDYSDARKPLESPTWICLEDDDLYITQHGDTNAFPVTFTSGTVDGEIYRLRYTGSDWRRFRFECEYEITIRIRGGRWMYISNLPADQTPPVTLLDIEFYDSRADARAAAQEMVRADRPSYAEPEAWLWAVVKAAQDDTVVVIDYAATDENGGGGLADIMLQEGVFRPGENVYSAVMKKGETFAIQVNLAWVPFMRIAAVSGAYYGEYMFGEENWLYRQDERGLQKPVYVTGHDLNGEKRGTDYQDETDLVNFLEGTWICLSSQSNEPAALFTFSDYRSLTVETPEDSWHFYLEYGRAYAGSDEAPDLIATSAYDDETREKLGGAGAGDRPETGSYLISAVQMYGEQLIRLLQVGGGYAALSEILPGAGDGDVEYSLVRYRGTFIEESQGQQEEQSSAYYGDDSTSVGSAVTQEVKAAFSQLLNLDETAEKISAGMVVYYDGMQTIEERECFVFDFGTDHQEHFVHEDYYAISVDLRYVYIIDPMTGDWERIHRFR